LHQERRKLPAGRGSAMPIAESSEILRIFCNFPCKYAAAREKTF
jgi:hypothetical protein